MTTATQVVGEKITYKQSIIRGTIVSAVWSVDSDGPALSAQADSQSFTTIQFACSVAGSYVLSVLLTLDDGQERIGQIRIDVLTVGV